MDEFLEAGRLRGGRRAKHGLIAGATQRGVQGDDPLDALDPRDPLDPLGQVIEVTHARAGQRVAVGIVDDHAEVGLTLARKFLDQVIADPGLRIGRQHADVAIGDADLEER